MTQTAAGTAPEFGAEPIKTPVMTVPPEWIDYNGHMNVAYYTMAFDVSSEHLFNDVLGVGEEFAKSARMGPMVIQQQLHYIGELLEGESFYCLYRLLDADAKRLHFFAEMRKASDDSLCALSETLSMNVDLEKRRSAPYPDDKLVGIYALRDAQAAMPRPEQAGASIGIRRK